MGVIKLYSLRAKLSCSANAYTSRKGERRRMWCNVGVTHEGEGGEERAKSRTVSGLLMQGQRRSC